MKRIIYIFILVAGMLLLPVGITADIPQISLPGELRQIINENRKTAFPPFHSDLENIVNSFVMRNLDRDEHIRIFDALQQRRIRLMGEEGVSALQRVFWAADLYALLTHEQITEEVRFLFDLLRHAYGGYLFFGGDDVFLPARDAIMEQLAGMSDPLPTGRYLRELLVPTFRRLVADNHFLVHNFRMSAESYVPFLSEEFILRKSGNGFVTVVDESLYRVIEVTHNGQPQDVILPTLAYDGEFVYVFGLVLPNWQEAAEITVFLENTVTGETYSRRINLSIVASPRKSTRPETFIREVDGITILESRILQSQRIILPGETDPFLQSAYELRGKPVFVMDLRGHTGGATGFSRWWMEIFTGQSPPDIRLLAASRFVCPLFVNSTLITTKVVYALQRFFRPPIFDQREMVHTVWGSGSYLWEMDPRFARSEGLESAEHEILPFSTSVPWTPLQAVIPNENLVIVLTDKNTGSAGEMFVGLLRQLENMLVVGTNTAGVLLTSSVGRTILPHSGLALIFGTQLNLRPDLSQFEGVGFMPDLWVPPGKSLERVLRFIERYGLANK